MNATQTASDLRPALETFESDAVFVIDPSVKARRRETVLVNVARVILGVALLGFWQLASGRFIDPFWISSPTAVATALVIMVQDGSLLRNTYATVTEALVGFGVGVSVGVALGLLCGINRVVARILDPYLVGFYSIPRVALIPLFILWLGIGFQTKVVYTSMLVFFPVFLNTLAGVRDVNRDLIDVIRVMGASKVDTVWKVLVPSAMAWLFAGLRISVPYALIGAVVAEMFTANVGLGYLISYNASLLDTGGLFAALAVTTALGLLLNDIVVRLEKRLLRWKPAGDGGH